MHDVAILALHGVVAADLANPCDIFGRMRLADGSPGYRVRVCGEAREVRSDAFNLRTRFGLRELTSARTIIVPGIAEPAEPVAPSVIAALRVAARGGARIASVCSGAFILAASGLLDGRRATTHWIAASDLARRYPQIRVDPGVLFVDEGQFITSAGATAGIDMCLHLIRRDYGQAAAAQAARFAVAPLDRQGGQAQFIRHEPPGSTASLSPLLDWMRANATTPLSLDDLARRAGTSPRTLSRRFKAQTGVSPLQWLLSARSRLAQELLETTELSIEAVAAGAGFEGTSTFRERFRRDVGVSPSRYRQTFNASEQSASGLGDRAEALT